MTSLQKKYPQYFGLSTAKGLEVYVWQIAEDSYSCGLLPGRNLSCSQDELLQLHTDPATVEEMIAILLSYEISGEEIVICPIHMPHASYVYEIDEAYRQIVQSMFREVISTSDTNH